jgi:hypothetical protein
VSGHDSEIDVPVRVDWAPGITVHAVIRAIDPATPRGGMGSPTLDASLDLDIPRRRSDAIVVAVARPRVAPGQDIVLRLTSPASGPHHATIAVVDDSVYQQVPDIDEIADPAREEWLGGLDAWYAPSWFGLEGWKSFSNPFYVPPKTVPAWPTAAPSTASRSPAAASPPPTSSPAYLRCKP